MEKSGAKQLPPGYKERCDRHTRLMMGEAKKIWNIVREFCSDSYVAQAQDDGLTVRIYKGEAPDCLDCNDRKWMVRAVERHKGFLIPEVFACPRCNEGGMEPPRLEKTDAADKG